MAVYSLQDTLCTDDHSTVPNLQHQHWHNVSAPCLLCWLLQGTKAVMRSAKSLCVLPWPGVLWTTAPPGPDLGICILIAAACILIIPRLPPRSSAPPRTLALRGTGPQQSQVNELSYCSPIVICTVSHYFAQIQTFTIQFCFIHCLSFGLGFHSNCTVSTCLNMQIIYM